MEHPQTLAAIMLRTSYKSIFGGCCKESNIIDIFSLFSCQILLQLCENFNRHEYLDNRFLNTPYRLGYSESELTLG